MRRFASLNDSSPLIRQKLQAALYYARKRRVLLAGSQDISEVWLPDDVALLLDFENDKAFLDDTVYPTISQLLGTAGVDFSRTAPAYSQQADLAYEKFTIGAPRITDRGLYVAPPAHNWVRNSDLAGNPAVNNALFSYDGDSSPLTGNSTAKVIRQTTQVVNQGYAVGAIDVAAMPTVSVGDYFTFWAIYKDQGYGAQIQVLSGIVLSCANNGEVSVTLYGKFAGGVYTADRIPLGGGWFILWGRVSMTSGGALRPELWIWGGHNYYDPVGARTDYAHVQLEHHGQNGKSYLMPVETSGAGAEIPADIFTIKPTSGVYDLTVTFDNGIKRLFSTTQITPAGWVVPQALEYRYIKSISAASDLTQWWGNSTYFADFANDQYYLAGVTGFSNAVNFTRPSVKSFENSLQTYLAFGTNELARSDLGASFEKGAVNEAVIDFKLWTVGGAPITQNLPGVDGGFTTAWLIDCPPGGRRQYNGPISADTENRVFSIFIKKTVGALAYYPAIILQYTNGGSGSSIVVIDTTTGEITDKNTYLCGCEDAGEFWRAWVVRANNGGAAAALHFYSAYSQDGSRTRDYSISGSQIVMWPQLEIGIKPTSPILSVSTTAARADDTVTLKLPAGAPEDMLISFGNKSYQLIEGVSGGDYSLDPSTLLHNVVKTIAWPATRPAVWDNFNRADGAIGVAPSGQSWVQVVNAAESYLTQSVVSGNALVTPEAAGALHYVNQIAYNSVDLGKKPTRMFAKFSFTAGTRNGSIRMAANANGLPTSSISEIDTKSLEVLFSDTTVQVRLNENGVIRRILNKPYPVYLDNDGSTVYTAGWEIEGDTIHVQIPFGVVLKVTDPRISDFSGRYLSWGTVFISGQNRGIFHHVEAA